MFSRKTPTHLLIFTLIAQLLGAAPAFAAYDRAVTWADMSAVDLRPVFKSQYSSSSNLFDATIPSSGMDVTLNDADQRVSREFEIPRELRGAVGFWLRIYTE